MQSQTRKKVNNHLRICRAAPLASATEIAFAVIRFINAFALTRCNVSASMLLELNMEMTKMTKRPTWR